MHLIVYPTVLPTDCVTGGLFYGLFYYGHLYGLLLYGHFYGRYFYGLLLYGRYFYGLLLYALFFYGLLIYGLPGVVTSTINRLLMTANSSNRRTKFSN